MTPIKLKFLSSYNRFIMFLLSILGFTSACNKDDHKMYEYGSPHAGFNVNGKIESALNNSPIPDIIVEARDVELLKTGFSKTDGTYKVGIGDFPGDHTYQIRFVDTDGKLNGEYETLDTTVVFKDSKYHDGDGSWFVGYTEQELNVKLNPKK